MKFICPKCNAALTIPDRQVPEAGAWARCPKCRERFYLKAKPVDLHAKHERAAAPPTRTRSSDAQSLIDRLRSRNNPDADTYLRGPDNDFGSVTVFPEPAPNYLLYAAGVGGMVGVFLAALGGMFNYEGPQSSTRAAAVFPAQRPYDHDGLRGDLMSIRRDLSQHKNVARQISYRGRESRVYKYFLAELAPDKCQEIIGVRLWSTDTVYGFNAAAECADDRLSVPELEVRWEGESARVAMAGQEKSMSVDLAPPPSMASNSRRGK